jgi:hypothetical protein
VGCVHHVDAVAMQTIPPPPPSSKPIAQEKGPEPRDVIAWLPENTQTLIVANGPFAMPNLEEDADVGTATLTPERVELVFQSMALSLFGFENGGLRARLRGQPVRIAVEGVARFRMPKGLGEGPFDGCAIAMFDAPITNASELEGTFQEKREADWWTTYVAFPTPNVGLVCTNREYMGAVMARIKPSPKREIATAKGARHWRYVDMSAPYWGLHVGGVAFTVNLRERRLNVAYVDDEELSAKLATQPGIDARPLRNGGVLEVSYSLAAPTESVLTCVLGLDAMLGHVVFL